MPATQVMPNFVFLSLVGFKIALSLAVMGPSSRMLCDGVTNSNTSTRITTSVTVREDRIQILNLETSRGTFSLFVVSHSETRN